jgi:Ni/Fe-hydrogenase 1 B-type cytochrome subunit
MASTAPRSLGKRHRREPLYVFEAPVRIWHWVHALSIVVLAVTGYLIANPLPSIGGEASEHFMMGNLRMIHFIAGYVFAIGFAVRIYFGIVGNRYSRELLYLPVWRREWWQDLFGEIKYYLFLRRDPPHSDAHNALAQTAMWFFNTLLGLFMIVTGFALYGEGLGLGSWADTWFGWAIPLLGGSQEVRMLHIFGMWLFIVFSILHIYMAIRADIMGSQSSVSTIISGWRTYKD